MFFPKYGSLSQDWKWILPINRDFHAIIYVSCWRVSEVFEKLFSVMNFRLDHLSVMQLSIRILYLFRLSHASRAIDQQSKIFMPAPKQKVWNSETRFSSKWKRYQLIFTRSVHNRCPDNRKFKRSRWRKYSYLQNIAFSLRDDLKGARKYPRSRFPD